MCPSQAPRKTESRMVGCSRFMAQILASMMFMLAALKASEAVDIEARERRVVTLQNARVLDGHGETTVYVYPILLGGTSGRNFRVG